MDIRRAPDTTCLLNCCYALLAWRFDPGCGKALTGNAAWLLKERTSG